MLCLGIAPDWQARGLGRNNHAHRAYSARYELRSLTGLAPACTRPRVGVWGGESHRTAKLTARGADDSDIFPASNLNINVDVSSGSKERQGSERQRPVAIWRPVPSKNTGYVPSRQLPSCRFRLVPATTFLCCCCVEQNFFMCGFEFLILKNCVVLIKVHMY